MPHMLLGSRASRMQPLPLVPFSMRHMPGKVLQGPCLRSESRMKLRAFQEPL